jgi:hypothetical protein
LDRNEFPAYSVLSEEPVMKIHLATGKAAEIIKTHQPRTLPETVQNTWERIRSEVQVRLKHNHFKA